MRTTVNIDNDLLEKLKREARRNRTSLGQTLNRVLRIGVERLHPEGRSESFVSPTFDLGCPLTSMDKALQMSAWLEDEETLHKLRLGK
ncbi:antitoxin [bacterium CPR1]|nr:antitoxin [bacterium CPR1]